MAEKTNNFAQNSKTIFRFDILVGDDKKNEKKKKHCIHSKQISTISFTTSGLDTVLKKVFAVKTLRPTGFATNIYPAYSQRYSVRSAKLCKGNPM